MDSGHFLLKIPLAHVYGGGLGESILDMDAIRGQISCSILSMGSTQRQQYQTHRLIGELYLIDFICHVRLNKDPTSRLRCLRCRLHDPQWSEVTCFLGAPAAVQLKIEIEIEYPELQC
jgi:hypothetical protein